MTKHEVVAVAGEKTAIPCDCTPTSSHPGDDKDDYDDVFIMLMGVCVFVCRARLHAYVLFIQVMMLMMMIAMMMLMIANSNNT